MATDPNVHPRWAEETKEMAKRLNQLDYFQVLGASLSVSHDELKAKYHQLQRNYHPDSFFGSPDLELRRAVLAISKRVTEAYIILRDPVKRRQYTDDINSLQRNERLRFDEQRVAEIRQETVIGATPQGRQLWAKALAALRVGNYTGAERDLKTALIFEGSNQVFKNKLEEIQAHLKNSPDA